jgi:hypothetical protein
MFAPELGTGQVCSDIIRSEDLSGGPKAAW